MPQWPDILFEDPDVLLYLRMGYYSAHFDFLVKFYRVSESKH
jgi:hypothetical protein